MSLMVRFALFIALFTATPLFHASAKDTTRILLFGDSIIAGYGVPKEDAVPAQLEKKLNEKEDAYAVVNGGVSGDTTSGGRSRLEWMLKKHTPDLVILALGGNDVLRGIPPSVTKENITAMMELLKSNNTPVVLSAVQAPASLGEPYQKEFNRIYADAATEYDAPLYPFLLTHTFGNNALMQPDGIHPNPDGAAVIAARLADYLHTEVLASK